jgi:hypothetical protein
MERPMLDVLPDSRRLSERVPEFPAPARLLVVAPDLVVTDVDGVRAVIRLPIRLRSDLTDR